MEQEIVAQLGWIAKGIWGIFFLMLFSSKI